MSTLTLLSNWNIPTKLIIIENPAWQPARIGSFVNSQARDPKSPLELVATSFIFGYIAFWNTT